MKDQKLQLQTILRTKTASARSVAVVGIGSELRGDDGAGLLVAAELAARWKDQPPRIPCQAFEGGPAPENITGLVRAFAPSHIVLVDAAELGIAPGAAALIETSAVGGGAGSTHTMPLSVLIDFLTKTMDAAVLLVGIQPKCVTFGAEMHADVRRGCLELAELLVAALA